MKKLIVSLIVTTCSVSTLVLGMAEDSEQTKAQYAYTVLQKFSAQQGTSFMRSGALCNAAPGVKFIRSDSISALMRQLDTVARGLIDHLKSHNIPVPTEHSPEVAQRLDQLMQNDQPFAELIKRYGTLDKELENALDKLKNPTQEEVNIVTTSYYQRAEKLYTVLHNMRKYKATSKQLTQQIRDEKCISIGGCDVHFPIDHIQDLGKQLYDIKAGLDRHLKENSIAVPDAFSIATYPALLKLAADTTVAQCTERYDVLKQQWIDAVRDLKKPTEAEAQELMSNRKPDPCWNASKQPAPTTVREQPAVPAPNSAQTKAQYAYTVLKKLCSNKQTEFRLSVSLCNVAPGVMFFRGDSIRTLMQRLDDVHNDLIKHFKSHDILFPTEYSSAVEQQLDQSMQDPTFAELIKRYDTFDKELENALEKLKKPKQEEVDIVNTSDYQRAEKMYTALQHISTHEATSNRLADQIREISLPIGNSLFHFPINHIQEFGEQALAIKVDLDRYLAKQHITTPTTFSNATYLAFLKLTADTTVAQCTERYYDLERQWAKAVDELKKPTEAEAEQELSRVRNQDPWMLAHLCSHMDTSQRPTTWSTDLPQLNYKKQGVFQRIYNFIWPQVPTLELGRKHHEIDATQNPAELAKQSKQYIRQMSRIGDTIPYELQSNSEEPAKALALHKRMVAEKLRQTYNHYVPQQLIAQTANARAVRTSIATAAAVGYGACQLLKNMRFVHANILAVPFALMTFAVAKPLAGYCNRTLLRLTYNDAANQKVRDQFDAAYNWNALANAW